MTCIKKATTLLYQTLYFFFCLQVAAPQVMAQLLYATRDGFPDTLEGAEFIEYRHGHGGGVCVFSLDGRRYVVKGSTHEDYIQQETLANILYKQAGTLVPDVAVYSTLGTLTEGHGFCQHLPVTSTFFMVADFIEGQNIRSLSDAQKQQAFDAIRPHILTDMLLSNWDLHADNIRLNGAGQPVRVDNGGSLEMGATGLKKPISDYHDPWSVTELRTMQQQSMQANAAVIGVQAQVFLDAIPTLLARKEAMLSEAYNFMRHFHMSNADTLFHQLKKRFDYLELLHAQSHHAIASTDEKVGLSAAGVFLYNNQKEVLLGKRAGSNQWCTPGGKSDPRIDMYLYDTAARETNEETHKHLMVSAEALRHAPSHTLMRDYAHNPTIKDINYRLYFAPQDTIDPATLLGPAPKEGGTTTESNAGPSTAGPANDDQEMLEFKWVPIKHLLSPSHRVTLDDGSALELYPSFHTLLHQAPVADIITRLIAGARLPQRHTQGLENAPIQQKTVQHILSVAPQMQTYKTYWDITNAASTDYEFQAWGKSRGIRTTVEGLHHSAQAFHQTIIANPLEERLQFARAVAQHGQVISSLKKHFTPPIRDAHEHFIPILGVSDHLMHSTLKDKWTPIDVDTPQEREQTIANIRAIFPAGPIF